MSVTVKLNVGMVELLPGQTLDVTVASTGMKPELVALSLSLVQGAANEDWVTVWFFEVL